MKLVIKYSYPTQTDDSIWLLAVACYLNLTKFELSCQLFVVVQEQIHIDRCFSCNILKSKYCTISWHLFYLIHLEAIISKLDLDKLQENNAACNPMQ